MRVRSKKRERVRRTKDDGVEREKRKVRKSMRIKKDKSRKRERW